MFFKTGALKNFDILTGKHPSWSLLIKLQAFRPAKRLQHRCFNVNITKFLRIPFLQNTSVGYFCCFKKLVNFPRKHQWQRPNTFIYLFNKYDWISKMLTYYDWLTFCIFILLEQYSSNLAAETYSSGFPCLHLK